MISLEGEKNRTFDFNLAKAHNPNSSLSVASQAAKQLQDGTTRLQGSQTDRHTYSRRKIAKGRVLALNS